MGGLFCCLYQHSILHNRYLSPENDVFLIFTLYIYGSHLHSPISIKCMIVYIVVLIYLHSWHYSITHSQTSVHVTLAGLVAINTPHYTHVQTAQKVTNLTPIYQQVAITIVGLLSQTPTPVIISVLSTLFLYDHNHIYKYICRHYNSMACLTIISIISCIPAANLYTLFLHNRNIG